MKNVNLILRGKRLCLRYPKPDDFDELTRLYRSSKEHFRGLAQPAANLEELQEWLDRNQSDTFEAFVICRNEDERIVGTITLSQIFRKKFQNAYLGYLLGAEFVGNGYMTEAVGIILRFAFTDLKLHRVEANVQPENGRSINVLIRSGFVKEGFSKRYLKISGRWRDHERWALIKEDWNGKRE